MRQFNITDDYEYRFINSEGEYEEVEPNNYVKLYDGEKLYSFKIDESIYKGSLIYMFKLKNIPELNDIIKNKHWRTDYIIIDHDKNKDIYTITTLEKFFKL